MSTLSQHIAQRIKSRWNVCDANNLAHASRWASDDELAVFIEAAIAEHEKANGPVADSSAQDAEDRVADGSLCQHCGKPESEHLSVDKYCSMNPFSKLGYVRFTPAAQQP